MRARLCLGLLLLVCASAWAQEDATNSQTSTDPSEDVQLRTPPPVSADPFPSEFAGVSEINMWRAGLTLTSAYSSNIGGSGANPVSDISYSVFPTFGIDKTLPRMHLTATYSPGFTVYQHTSAYNQFDQNLSVGAQFQLSPNMSLNVQEGFQKFSNVFNQPNAFSNPVSGSLPLPKSAVIVPVADQIDNGTTAQLTYQTSANGMLGGGGSFGTLYYPNPTQVPGLYDSRTIGSSFFYSQRISDRYYVGGTYQFQDILSSQAAPNLSLPSQTQTQTQTIFGFVSIYLKPTLTLSVSAGPQHYNATQIGVPPSASWTPMTMASLGWQGERTTLAVSYSRIVTGGGGLNGAYHSNSAGASASWQMSRDWTAGLAASYANYTTLTPLFIQASPGGHALTGTVSLQRTLTDHLNLQFGYNWVHQTYGEVTSAVTPNINRAFFSISYQLSRPLQR